MREKFKCKITKEVIKRFQEKVIKYWRSIEKVEHTDTSVPKEPKGSIRENYENVHFKETFKKFKLCIKFPFYTWQYWQ